MVKVTVNLRVNMMSKLIEYLDIKIGLIPTPKCNHMDSKTKMSWSLILGFYGAELGSFMVPNLGFHGAELRVSWCRISI